MNQKSKVILLILSLMLTMAPICGRYSVTENDVAPGPAISVSTTSLAFGSVLNGVASGAQSVLVTNIGNGAMTVSAIAISGGTAPGDFAVITSQATPFTLVRGASQSLYVTFTPGAAGARTTTLNITSDGGNASVSLSGTGVATSPILSISATSLAFGSVLDGVASNAQSLIVTNTGNTAMTVSAIANSGGDTGDFLITTSTATPFTLAKGDSQSLFITFTPGGAGARTTTLNITSNGGNASVSLSGTGVAIGPIISVELSLPFGNVSCVWPYSATMPLIVHNTGNAVMTISDIVLTSGVNFSSIPSGLSLGINVNPGDIKTLYVTFTPTVSGTGLYSDTLNITSDGGNASVSLSGNGI